MSLQVRDDAAALKSVADIRMRDVSAAIRDIGSVWMRDAAAALKLVWSRFSVTLDKAIADGVRVSYHITGVTSEPVTAIPNGGVAPLVYEWERTDTNPEDWVIIDGDRATARFRTVLAAGGSATAFFRCKVSDGSGVTEASAPVTVNCSNDGIP